MIRFQIVTVLLLKIFAIQCFSQSGFKIEGILSGFKDSAFIYFYDRDADKFVDSTRIINNKFYFTGKVESIAEYSLRIKHPIKNRWLRRDFWIENCDINFKANSNDFSNGEFKGLTIQTQENMLDQRLDSINNCRSNIVAKLRKINSTDKKQNDSLVISLNRIDSLINEKKIEFVYTHNNLEYSSYILYSLINSTLTS